MTPQQLKLTNLIFSEHELLIQKVPLLTNQIVTLEEINKTYIEQDSLKSIQLDLYKNLYIEKESEYIKLDKKFENTKKCAIFGSIVTFILGIVVCH